METSKTQNEIKCSICGAVFDPDSNTCGGCALNKDCKLICCPNCGFGIPGESKLSKWLKKKHEKQGSDQSGME